MPSRGRKFITEFLLPSLNEETFGPRLKWLDIKNKVFQIQWNHKSASDWTTNHAVVFAAWDKRQGHYKPNDPEYYSKSKQRFRAALYKFIKHKHITELPSDDKYTKIYCIGNGKNILKTLITFTKSKKDNGNEDSEIELKPNPEDLIINLNSVSNFSLLNNPLENISVVCDYPEMEDMGYITEEQVVTDSTDEFSQDTQQYENLQQRSTTIYYHDPSPNSSNNKENFSSRETANIMKESEDIKTVYVEFLIPPEKNNYVEDHKLKTETVDYNFHDYLSTMKAERQIECPNELLGLDENLSLDLLLPFVGC